MVKTPSFKCLILRAVLRQVSPMVIRLVSVSDQMPPHEFHDVFRTILMLSAKAMSTGESDFSQEVERTLMKQTKTKGRRTGHIF
jgi:hypothetical protein